MNKKMSKKKKLLFLIITGVLLSGVSAFASYLINSSEVEYDPETSGLSSTNVQGAIDELYSRTSTLQSEKEALQQQLEELQNQPSCPEGLYCGFPIGIEFTIGGEIYNVIDSNVEITTLLKKVALKDSNGSRISTWFSNYASSYWSGKMGAGNQYPDKYVYDSHSLLYQYIEDYKLTLPSIVKNVRLLKYEDALKLKDEYNLIAFNANINRPNIEWFSSSSFWLGTASNDTYIYMVDGYGAIVSVSHNGSDYAKRQYAGIRPVIEVNTSDLIE